MSNPEIAKQSDQSRPVLFEDAMRGSRPNTNPRDSVLDTMGGVGSVMLVMRLYSAAPYWLLRCINCCVERRRDGGEGFMSVCHDPRVYAEMPVRD